MSAPRLPDAPRCRDPRAMHLAGDRNAPLGSPMVARRFSLRDFISGLVVGMMAAAMLALAMAGQS